MSVEKQNLMVIDDEAAMRSLLRDFFLSQGYSVECFSSAPEALKAIRENNKPLAIISDVRMYPMDGIDFLRIAKRDFPQIPILLFTGAGSVQEKAQALKMGAAQYLAKPFSLATLNQLVQSSLTGIKSNTTVKN